MGHELSGTVAAALAGSGLVEGQPVYVVPSYPAGDAPPAARA
jgi:threonine dehydrogenase-like Zn-dependent dehydrogenase